MVGIKAIKDKIELMDKYHQIEVLRILNKDPHAVLNENSNGVFVNLTDLDKNSLKKLEEYINYVQKQQKHLSTIETEKENLENTYFKDNKETTNVKITTNG